jgi:Spy/CpxP family protein refolding chaperone
MRTVQSRLIVAALLVIGAVGMAGAQQGPRQPLLVIPWGGPPFAWWRDANVQKELGLTTDQANRINTIFLNARPHLREKADELNAQENELSRLVETDADESSIVRQSKRVESVRAALNTNRTLMVWQIRQVLTPDQRAKIKALSEQWEKDHPAPPRGGDRAGSPRRN